MADPDQDEVLLMQSGHFEYKQRRPRDVQWGLTYALFLAFSVVGGIYSVTHRNPQFSKLNKDYLDDPAHCPYDPAARNLLAAEKKEDFDLHHFFETAGTWLLISAAGSVVIGFLFLWLFKNYAGFMTRATIAIQIALPLTAGTGALFAGQPGIFVSGITLSVLAAVVFFLWRNEVALCARLLKVSAEALQQNWGILPFVLIAQLVSAVIVLPLFGFNAFAYANGHVVPNGARQGSSRCVDPQGHSVVCCSWEPNAWGQAYLSINTLVLLWTIFLFNQIRVFVISGAVAQWYFAPPGSNGPPRKTLRALKYAVGPSFGSLALGGLILAVVQMLREISEQARQSAREAGGGLLNLVVSLLTCCLEIVYTLIEFITKFATVMIAITGQSFFEGGRTVTELLKRNFLKAFGVWFFPPLILQAGQFILAAAWGILLYSGAYVQWKQDPQGNMQAIVLGALSFFISLVVLSFFGSVLLNIVDAVFVCYALDRDTHAVTHPEVHDVYNQLPVGAVVEQPDGGVAYAAPGAAAGGGADRYSYVPPAQQQAAPAGHSYFQGDSSATV